MRPLRKARRVNSPGSAGRQPSRRASARSTAARTARPPWMCSSAWSSPVKLLGRASRRRGPGRAASPVRDRAGSGEPMRRASARAPARASSSARQSGPLIRTTLNGGPAEAGGRGEDRVVGTHGSRIPEVDRPAAVDHRPIGRRRPQRAWKRNGFRDLAGRLGWSGNRLDEPCSPTPQSRSRAGRSLRCSSNRRSRRWSWSGAACRAGTRSRRRCPSD